MPFKDGVALPYAAEFDSVEFSRGARRPDSAGHGRQVVHLLRRAAFVSSPELVPADVTEPLPGIFQHHVSGTGYRQVSHSASPPEIGEQGKEK